MSFIHPRKWLRLTRQFFYNLYWYYLIPDKVYLVREYKKEHGVAPNIDNPSTIDEKLLWLKLYDRKPIYHTMIDKVTAKQFVAERIGIDYVVPLYGVWKHYDDIDFSQLPTSFVLKCNHDSGSVVIVKDKDKIDAISTKNRLEYSLKQDYYHYMHKQWGYKGIKPVIMAEELLTNDALEYQVFCNNETPIMFLIRSDLRIHGEGFAVCYSIDWKKLDYRVVKYPNVNLPKPQNYSKMLEFSKRLSKGTKHVRVDFYEMADGRLYFGELTFYSNGGNHDNFTEEGKRYLADTLFL